MAELEITPEPTDEERAAIAAALAAEEAEETLTIFEQETVESE